MRLTKLAGIRTAIPSGTTVAGFTTVMVWCSFRNGVFLHMGSIPKATLQIANRPNVTAGFLQIVSIPNISAEAPYHPNVTREVDYYSNFTAEAAYRSNATIQIVYLRNVNAQG